MSAMIVGLERQDQRRGCQVSRRHMSIAILWRHQGVSAHDCSHIPFLLIIRPRPDRRASPVRHIVGGGRRSPAANDGYRDPPPLSWRLDPDESLSDWTLTVASTDSVPCSPRRRTDTERACQLLAAPLTPTKKQQIVNWMTWPIPCNRPQ